MPAAIQSIVWHSFPAIKLENESMSTVIVPDIGAKIVSLFDKVHSCEWLVPPMRPMKQNTPGQCFIDQDMSGWDEMMPTIVACKWGDLDLPDHGEVWSIPWKLEKCSEGVKLSVCGQVMPYRLTRTASLIASACLKLDYELKNIGDKAFPWLWAAHPQFSANLETRIILPDEVKRVINVIDEDYIWGKAGTIHDWPLAASLNGDVWRLDHVRSPEKHTCRKFYIPPELHVDWAALQNESLGCKMKISWEKEKVPYLGLWVDEGKYNNASVVAPEPSTGYYDNLNLAAANQKAPILVPGEIAEWTIIVELDQATFKKF